MYYNLSELILISIGDSQLVSVYGKTPRFFSERQREVSKEVLIYKQLPDIKAFCQRRGKQQHALAVLGALIGKVHGAQL